MKNKLDLVQMDLPEKYKTIEDTFLVKSLIDSSNIIDDIYDSLLEEEKKPFLRWLELEFLNKLLIVKKSNERLLNDFGKPGQLYPNSDANNLKLDYLQEWIKEKKASIIKPEFNEIDLSDTSATEKIIYLEKLGVIGFLRSQQPFVSVPDKVSQVLSAITGINIYSIRPMLRPIMNKDPEHSKNPLNSKNAVARVEKQLIKIGFNLDETN
jgi:hypothetical protein